MAKPPPIISITVEDISPQKAREYLGRGKARRPSRKHIERLAATMRDGVWRLMHQGILIGPRGALLDGRARLHAIIKADVTVRMMVTRGVRQQDIIRADRFIIDRRPPLRRKP